MFQSRRLCQGISAAIALGIVAIPVQVSAAVESAADKTANLSLPSVSFEDAATEGSAHFVSSVSERQVASRILLANGYTPPDNGGPDDSRGSGTR